MYEEQTYEVILQRALDRVPDELDKRESSFLFNAAAPVSVEHQNMYLALDNFLALTFFDTSDRGGKLERCKERGIDITIFDATPSIVIGTFTPATVEIAIGERFNYDMVNFVVTEKIEDGKYRLQCETAGAVGNVTGAITPINYVRGLVSSEITAIETYGEEEADVSVIDSVYYASINSTAFGGNRADYMLKVKQIPGVGGVKLYSASEWKGGGTCRIVITSSSYTVPEASFVNQVQNMIDPPWNQGAGYGTAPIGHTVTVDGATATTVNISSNITLAEGYEWEDVEPHIQSAIDEYFQSINEQWEDNYQTIVRISQIETRILDVAGVIDIFGTALNDNEANLYLDRNSLAVRGVITNATT